MAFKEVQSLDCDTTTALGGKNKQGQNNPTKVEGYYLGSRTVPSAMSKTGTAKIHIFQTPKGSTGVWGKTDMDRKMTSATLGAMTRVSFTGFQANPKPGRKPMYLYSVQVDLENAIEVNLAQEDAGGVVEEDTAAYTSDDSAPVYDDGEPGESDVGEEEVQPDELPPVRAKPPQRAASLPSPEAQARARALLSKAKGKAA